MNLHSHETDAQPTIIVAEVNSHAASDPAGPPPRSGPVPRPPRGAVRKTRPAPVPGSGQAGRDTSKPSASVAPGEVVVGEFLGVGDSGALLVTHPLNIEGVPLVARSVVPLGPSHQGRAVVIAFEEGDRRRPLVLGCIWQGTPVTGSETPGVLKASVTMDGEQLVFKAEKEIVLRCGEASLTLTRAGKVLIRGAYVLSRSSGVNRIKGGSVQIN